MYLVGAVVVAIWTWLRFFTQRTVFDLVSQQVIVQQWLHGAVSPAHMGQTAYVPKMLLLYTPLDVLPGSPRLKLLVLTVLVNIATFVLLGLVLEKLLHEFRVHAGSAFYDVLLWLSVIAGSVFWIQFANSRNLEVVGGLFWAYLGLRLLRAPSWRLRVGLVALGGLLFFDDPLQVFMSAFPVFLYALVLVFARKQRERPVLELFGTLAAGYAVALVLFAAAGHWLHISFTDTGGVHTPSVTLTWVRDSFAGAGRAAPSLFVGGSDAGRLREVANVAVVVLGAAALAYTWLRRLVPKRFMAFLACWIAVDTVVYITSGQAVQGAATARYLIMLAPMLVLALGTVRIPRQLAYYAAAFMITVVGVNVITLSGALVSNWDTSFPKDAGAESAYRYIGHRAGLHAYGSIDTAMAMQYFHRLPAEAFLPVGCLDGKLVRTHFSMDTSFQKVQADSRATAAIILDGNSIQNTPNVCTAVTIAQQFGQPLGTDRTAAGDMVMIYPQAQLQLPD